MIRAASEVGSIHVGLDVSSAIDPRPSGIARYIHGLVAGLSERPEIRLTLLCRGSRWRRGDPRAVFPNASLVRWYDWRTPRRFDVIHAPDLRIPRRPPTTVVATVHDLSAFDRSDHATARFVEKKRAQLARVGAHAARVITHTEAIRADLIERAGFDAVRVCAVPLWAALPATTPVRRRCASSEREGLLLVGGPSLRKRSDRITAFLERWDAAAAGSSPPDRVFWCGSASPADAHAFFGSLPSQVRDRIEWLGHIDDGELDQRLRSARAFVQLSDTEGFGIPLLESAMRRCPVVAWRCATAEEVLSGEAAFWIGETDEAAELAAFLDEGERAGRVRRAQEIATRTDLARMIEGTIAVYRDAITARRASVSVG